MATPTITSHKNGDTVSASATFSWNSNGQSVDGYRLMVGGQCDDPMYHNSGDLASSVTSHTCTGWPTIGYPIVVTLQWWGGGSSGSHCVWVMA